MEQTATVQPVKIGEKVPNLAFGIYHNDEDKKGTLHDYLGKWLILFFYPADFTFVCPTELKEMAEHYGEFKKEGAEVLSVSTDTVFVHKAWHDHSPVIKKIEFPMAADPTGALCRNFGTYLEHEGLSLRASFIINPEGVLKAVEMNDNDVGRSARELLRKLKALRYVAEHPGLACPASWEPGAETLKPGLDLVGKI